MRKQWISAALLGLVLAVPVAGLHADDSASDQGMGMGGKEHHWDANKMKKELGLTDDQVTKLKAINDSQKEAMKATFDKNKDAMKKLEDQVKNKASDTDLQASLDEIRANHKAMADQMEQFRTQKDAILTPTQQAKMMIMRMKHFKKMMHGHGKHSSDKSSTQDTDTNKG